MPGYCDFHHSAVVLLYLIGNLQVFAQFESSLIAKFTIQSDCFLCLQFKCIKIYLFEKLNNSPNEMTIIRNWFDSVCACDPRAKDISLHHTRWAYQKQLLTAYQTQYYIFLHNRMRVSVFLVCSSSTVDKSNDNNKKNVQQHHHMQTLYSDHIFFSCCLCWALRFKRSPNDEIWSTFFSSHFLTHTSFSRVSFEMDLSQWRTNIKKFEFPTTIWPVERK